MVVATCSVSCMFAEVGCCGLLKLASLSGLCVATVCILVCWSWLLASLWVTYIPALFAMLMPSLLVALCKQYIEKCVVCYYYVSALWCWCCALLLLILLSYKMYFDTLVLFLFHLYAYWAWRSSLLSVGLQSLCVLLLVAFDAGYASWLFMSWVGCVFV